MAKSLYNYISKAWKRPKQNLGDLLKRRVSEWRKQQTVVRIEKPTRLNRARALGYKAKKGYVLARVKVRKGGRRRPAYHRGRKPIHAGLTGFTPKKSLRWIAEEKAARKFVSLEVLNSYEVADAGNVKFFEVILVDTRQPTIRSDPRINWICNPKNRRRVMRGLTAAGKKARGLK